MLPEVISFHIHDYTEYFTPMLPVKKIWQTPFTELVCTHDIKIPHVCCT